MLVNKSFITDKCNSREGIRLDYKIFVNFAFQLAKNCKGLLYLAKQLRPPFYRSGQTQWSCIEIWEFL